jgi:hypothetical protein
MLTIVWYYIPQMAYNWIVTNTMNGYYIPQMETIVNIFADRTNTKYYIVAITKE